MANNSGRGLGPSRGDRGTESAAPGKASSPLTIDPDSDGYDEATGRIAIAGATGEVVTFELHLRAAGRPLSGVNVLVDSLLGTEGVIHASTIRLFRVHPVRVGRLPGWHLRSIAAAERNPVVYDVVVPVDAPTGGLPASIDAGQSIHVFGEITVSPGAAAGIYATTLTVQTRRGKLLDVPLELTVWPLVLPETMEPVMLAYLDHHRFSQTPTAAGDDDALDQTVRLLRSHGVQPVLHRLRPVAKLDRQGNINVDWDDYDRVMNVLIGHPSSTDATARPWFRVPFDDGFPIAKSSGALLDPNDAAIGLAYLRNCAEHFAERGWLDRSYVDVPGPFSDAQDTLIRGSELMRQYGLMIRRADPRLRAAWSAYAPLTPDLIWDHFESAGLADLIDIWSPPAQFCDPTAAKDGRTTWMRVDRPPYSGTLEIGAPPTHTRVLAWQAQRYRIPTVILGHANRWPDGVDLSPQACIDVDPSVLIYPGKPFGLRAPVASMRLKRLRRGLQDLAYLELLRSEGLGYVAETLVDALCPYALVDAYRNHVFDPRNCGWVGDPKLWTLGLRIMADELVLKRGGAGLAPQRELATVMRWRRFVGRTRRLELSVEGVRVRPTRDPGTNRVEFLIRLENWTRTPMSGFLSFASLPIGWEVAEPEVVVAPVAPTTTRRVVMIAHARSMAWGTDGLLRLPIIFRTQEGRTHRLSARLAHIASQECGPTITIDGDLADWQVGSGNVAGGFASITGARSFTESTVGDRPDRTRCLVAHDDTFVYFAFRCLDNVETHGRREQGNFVRYRDRIPADEELVEILIDPGNAGTHAAEDLYHIVIKQNGAVFERGISADPRSAARTVWAADIRYAARTEGSVRTIEVRIPRSALGARQRGPQIWGINFTRFDAGRQEYTNWSGAVGNVYDPMTLGNLTLP